MFLPGTRLRACARGECPFCRSSDSCNTFSLYNRPRKQSKLLLSAALIASSFALSSTRAEDDHDHELCQCIAGLSIDCSTAMTTTQAALDYLEANKNVCQTATNSAECKSNYYVMQAHHDHCAHDDIPHEVEHEIHDFESYYEECKIRRQYDSHLSNCPAVDCSNLFTTDGDIVAEMGSYNCNTDCSSDECKIRYQKMLMYHDTCAENQLPTGLEKGMHDYEEKCENHLCNTASAAFTLDTSVCSSALSAIALSSKFLLGLAGFAAYFSI